MEKEMFMFGKQKRNELFELYRSQRETKIENDSISQACPQCSTIYTILERFKCSHCKRDMCEVCANKKEVNVI